MDFNALVTFVEVIRTGSFAAASRALDVPANTLSRRVQSLEAALGLRLIQRSTRQLAATSAGQFLFDQCREAIATIAAAGRLLESRTNDALNTLRIATPIEFFDYFDPLWLQEFFRLHASVRLEFLLSDGQVNLISDRVDMALRRGPLASSRLVARRLWRDKHILVASPDYLLRQGTPTQIGELASHECITSVSSQARHCWCLSQDGSQTEVSVSGRFASDNIAAAHKAALAGLGIALLPALLIASDMQSSRLTRVLPDVHREAVGFYAVSVGGGSIPAAASLFANFVSEKMTDKYERSRPPADVI